MESLFEKMFHQNIIPKKHIVPFFRNYNFRILFQKVLYQKIIQKKNIVPFFSELYFFKIYFGGTLLKKDSKIIVPKKGTIFFFGIIFW